MNNYGIHLNVTINQSSYQSHPYVTNCNHKNNINTLCLDCKNIGTGTDAFRCYMAYHHKGVRLLLPDPKILEEQTNVCLLYTGHKSCDFSVINNTIFHEPDNSIRGISVSLRNSVAVFSHQFVSDLNTNNIDMILRTTIHELIHILGRDGHCQNANCIMYTTNSYVAKNLLVCSACSALVNQNKSALFNNN